MYLESFTNGSEGLGNFSLSEHHAYDPNGQVLYRGDGSRRSAADLAPVFTDVMAIDTNGRAVLVPTGPTVYEVHQLDVGADGSLYIAERSRVRRYWPNGTMTTVAGSDVDVQYNINGGFGGDNGPGINALLAGVTDVKVGPDGSIYIADDNNCRVRKVAPNGVITTIAGGGTSSTGENVSATSVSLCSPWEPMGLAVFRRRKRLRQRSRTRPEDHPNRLDSNRGRRRKREPW